ncbi:MAG: plasmid pRiA4b ORF-3 family protein [Candidatus Nanopelagicales bacterium]
MVERQEVADDCAAGFQFRVVLEGVSPLVWRRLLIPGGTSIARLHEVLQLAFGWDGEHLHRFVIHGREYGIGYVGGIGFSDDPHLVGLSRFGRRSGERFRYEYDFTAGWRLQLRVEQVLAPVSRQDATCTDGRRAGPPPRCLGAWEYLAFRARHTIVEVAERVLDIAADRAGLPEHRDELDGLRTWLGLDHFDRAGLNRSLVRGRPGGQA